MLKIVHCADLHIGAPCTDASANKASIRREEVKNSLTDIVDFCLLKSADILLICGDLFDTPFPDMPDIFFVQHELERLKDIPVFIVAGNHDFLCTHSVFSAADIFGSNVHIFPDCGQCFDFPEKNLRLYGRSYSSACISPQHEFSDFSASSVNILCLHGNIGESGDYCAVTKSALSKSGAAYCALGHIHTASVFNEGGIQCAYPGTPEGHGFDDDGITGFIYAEISKEVQSVTHICHTQRKYIRLNINITDLQTNNRIIAEAEKLITMNNLYRVYIIGSLSPESDFSRAYIENCLSCNAFSVRVFDQTTPAEALDDLLSEESPRGYFLRELKKLTNDNAMFEKAARIGLNALYSRETDI